MRGTQRRRLRSASICSGTIPEAKGYKRFNIGVEHEFSCENKVSAINFAVDNMSESELPKHMFLDLQSLALTGDSLCYRNDCRPVTLGKWQKKTTDILLADVSCKGYSFARTGRQDNWSTHGDVWQLDAFLLMLINLEPL